MGQTGVAWTTNPSALDMLATLSPDLLTPDTVGRAANQEVGWCAPEILRAEGENLLRTTGPSAATQAETLFLRGLVQAREQGALAWELRLSTSLAALWQDTRAQEAHALLSQVVDRFVEGLETADLVRAREVLSALIDGAEMTTRQAFVSLSPSQSPG